VSSRGAGRAGWWAAALVSLAVLIMTVSRGAFVAGILGTIWALYMCRRWLPSGIVARSAAIGAVSLVLVIVFVSVALPDIGGTLKERMLGQTTALDIDEVSSGRTAIWSAAVSRMMSTPLTLITGFGWDAYNAMPFHFATHNHYLNVWFELGIPGLAAFVFILAYVIVMARRALDAPANPMRPYLLGFLFGMFPLTIAIFFGNLVNPWPYVWLYIGIAMRAAVLALETAPHGATVKRGEMPRTQEPVAIRRPRILGRTPTA
jgi:O-antigen ligase